jgi:hypothetical protein
LALFVINEWLWHDCSGENGVGAQKEALAVIWGLTASQHQIIVIEGSGFDQKAWSTCKMVETTVVTLAKTFVTSIRQNSDRCRLLKLDTAVELPAQFVASVKPDDHYLVRALLTVPGSILITTDEPLCEIVQGSGLTCILREEFLSTYFGGDAG